MTSTGERPPHAAPAPPGLARLNARPTAAAAAELRAVCASHAWVAALLARRPYPSAAHLLATSDAATAALTDADLAQAVAGHPPIGRPAAGDPTSAREQHGMTEAEADLKRQMVELNRAYQSTFGQVFLICATGLSGEQLRDALRDRLGNPPERERAVVRAELAKINRLRLTRLVEEGAA
ncbi:2-oxo-4-hydroxy-4-carboxy-5-ureidoimidazoline decarboxylase [Streptomyces odontomachi]|uniref:2-oxo-4-hydroxy-4-carboxy-5-ureidoimidazoline decarboxylase n=1 Tax=Streptomyces odontomachi TaxID=2944940 RepID=UPI00210C039B|nr:2-oxo-4-hydroxy-4-carboxy-5-ureidoimidazoline decarboxylase [Streptomyces sp. ODS25]